MKMSKNRDKIIKKVNYNKPLKVLPETARAMEQMLHHTNNLLMYKAKMKDKIHLEEDIYEDNSNFAKKNKQMKDAVHHFDRITKSMKDNNGKINEDIHEKLNHNIDKLIKDLDKHI